MSYVSYIIILFSAFVGAVLDIHYVVNNACLYWFIGTIFGFLVGTIEGVE